MAATSSIAEPHGYNLKRYGLMFVCSLQVSASLAVAACSGVLAEDLAGDGAHEDAYHYSILIAALITVCFEFCGLVGAWKECLYPTLLFAAQQTLASLITFLVAFSHPFFWSTVLWFILTTLLTLFYLIDLLNLQKSIRIASQGQAIALQSYPSSQNAGSGTVPRHHWPSPLAVVSANSLNNNHLVLEESLDKPPSYEEAIHSSEPCLIENK